MDLLTGKIISMVLLGALSLFFGLIPLRIQKRLMKTDEGKPAEIQKKQRRRRDLVVSCLLCFGAGVLLATVFMHMLPETRENVALINKEHYGNDAKHEHLRDDRGLEAMQGMDDHDVEGSGYPTSPAPGMMMDSNNNPVPLTSDVPAASSVFHEDHSHDDNNHVHRRSAGDMINEDLAPTTAGSSKLNVDTTERNQHGDYDHNHGNHDHGNHDHGSHDHDHEASGMPHLKVNEALELTEGSGSITETVTESLAAFEAESATREGEVVLPGATTDNNVDGPLHNDHAGHLHAEGDDHDHNHAHDHASHDHAHDHDHSGHDHDHKEERTDKDLKEAKGPDADTAGGRSLIDHSGHLHDHNHGPYDRTHANLQLNENLPRTSESPHGHHDHDHHDHAHDHHDHDHENDLGSEVLPLHKGGNNSSSAAIHDASGHEHHDHGEHGAHDHDSPAHAHAHGEHDHEHEAHSYPIAELLICLGFFFVYLVEEIVHKVVFHQHSHSASKRGSRNDGGIVLKNRHSEEDRLPPVTNGTYRSRSVHSNVHPYAAESNGSAASGDFNARVNSGGNLPPKDVWSTSGVDNPSFVNETEVEGQLNHHVGESDLVDVPLDSPLSKSNSSTLRSFPFECETPKEPLFCNKTKKSMKNKKHENNNVPKVEELRLQRLYSITSDYGSQTLQEDENQMTIVPCYDTMGNSLVTRRFRTRRHSSPIVPEHLMLQMSRVSVTPHTVGHGHSHMADISELKSQDWVSNLRSLIIVLALSFHAVFEGLAVGLQQNVQDVWYLFYAIAAHKLVIAFCVGLELISGGTKVLLTVVYMVVFALVTPLGIAIGIIVTEGTSSPKSFGHMWTVTVLQGIAGGTILYVTFCEVLERERNRKNGRFLKFFSLVIGFSTMAIIELVGAHKHSH